MNKVNAGHIFHNTLVKHSTIQLLHRYHTFAVSCVGSISPKFNVFIVSFTEIDDDLHTV